jgi:DNA-binding CsgD family transcriptional regulator
MKTGADMMNIKLAKEITKIKSLKEAWSSRVEPSVHKIGFDYGVCCFISADRSTVEVVTTENAIPWVKHHIASGYTKYDPATKAAFEKKRLIWNFVEENDKTIKKIMNERRDYGMRSGISVPLLNKFGDFTAGISLSTKNSQKCLDSTISDPFFTEKVYEIHIKTVSHALSKLSGIRFNICYAIVLSHYTNNVNIISQKTGFLVDELHKLYSHLYLYGNNIDFFCLDIQQTTVDCVKNLNHFLKQSDSLKYKFSKKQRECIELIKKGLTAKQAARVLKISHRTYEWYTSEIRHKLECNNQRELIFKLSNRQLMI